MKKELKLKNFKKIIMSEISLLLIVLFLILQFIRPASIGDAIILGFLVILQLGKMYVDFMSPKEEEAISPEMADIQNKIKFLKIQREFEFAQLELAKLANAKTQATQNNQRISF